jgi:hypothetical protein
VGSDNGKMVIYRASTSERWVVRASDNTLFKWVCVLKKGGLVPGGCLLSCLSGNA